MYFCIVLPLLRPMNLVYVSSKWDCQYRETWACHNILHSTMDVKYINLDFRQNTNLKKESKNWKVRMCPVWTLGLDQRLRICDCVHIVVLFLNQIENNLMGICASITTLWTIKYKRTQWSTYWLISQLSIFCSELSPLSA